jgi:hypothetical protein
MSPRHGVEPTSALESVGEANLASLGEPGVDYSARDVLHYLFEGALS